MTAMTEFDRRLGSWLEDGPQTIPDWLVEQALEEAHATAQLSAGLRPPWLRRRRGLAAGRLVPATAGALGTLAVLSAFILGLTFAVFVGVERPSPTPGPSQSSSPGPPSTVAPRPVGGLEAVDVLPGETPDYYVLVGLASTGDAVWTAVVTGQFARLVRIDAATGQATVVVIPGAGMILSPPVADGASVWTGSGTTLYRVEASGAGTPLALPIGVTPGEIDVSPEGLWVAREGGTTLVDRTTGSVLREVAAPGTTVTGRIVGAPAFGSLWACPDSFTVERLDEIDGSVTGSVGLADEDEDDCNGRVYALRGASGLDDGVIPLLANVVIDPATATVASRFDVGLWSDVIVIDGRPWFLEILRDTPGLPVALIELEPETGRPAQILTFDGQFHLNAAFESGYLAVAGDYLWVLADPGQGAPADSPQIIRIPLSELRAG